MKIYWGNSKYFFEQLISTQCQVLEANGERNHEDNEGKLKGKRTIDDLTMADSLTTTQCQVRTENGERNHDDNAGMLREKGTIDGNAMPDSGESTPMSSYNYHYHCLFDERKRSIVWTPELHLKFTEAMHMIGENSTITFPSHSPYIEWV